MAQLIQVVLSAVVDRIQHDVKAAVALAVAERMEEAYFDLWVFLPKKHFDVLNALGQGSEVLPEHNFVAAEYNREGLMVFVDVQEHMMELLVEDVWMEMVDSKTVGKGFVHKAKQCSARRDVAVVLDP